jgi:acyl carrier protein
MTRDELRAAVVGALAAIAPETDPSAIDATASLRDELDIDSMDFLAFVTALHDRTGVTVPETEYPSVDSIDGAVAYLAAHMQG